MRTTALILGMPLVITMRTVILALVIASTLTSCGWKCSAYPELWPDGKGGVDVYKYNIRCSKTF